MEIDNIFSTEIIFKFFSQTSIDELKDLKEIYLICHPGNRLVVRKLRLKPIPASWDPKWTPSRTPLFDPRRCVIDERIRFKKIMDWYEKHQEEYPDLKTVEGQKRLGKDTGEEGGSLILRFFHGKKKRHEELTKVFLILARAFNSGEIPTNKLIVISLKVFDDSDDEDSRIKISTNSREDLPQILREIHKILLNANSPDFFLRYKTDVACCLNQYFTDFFKIECPVEGWSYNIEELIEQIASL